MAGGHPVDADGRVLPRSDWPADRRAPDPLESVRRFCNTTNLETGADRLADPADLDAWLAEWSMDAVRVDDRELAILRDLREHLRAAAVAHRDGRSDADALAAVAALAGDIHLRFDPTASPVAVRAIAASGTVQALVGDLAIAVAAALADGTWTRLKACRNCRWVVYDRSRNASAQWCSMSACGGRAKVRAHRRRVSTIT